MSTAETEHGPNPTVDDVLETLATLLDRLDHYRGFCVRHPRSTSTGGPLLDRDVVEVRVTPSEYRHPVNADHALGILRDAGYHVERELRGGQSNVRIVVSVRGEPEGDDHRPASGGGQPTL